MVGTKGDILGKKKKAQGSGQPTLEYYLHLAIPSQKISSDKPHC